MNELTHNEELANKPTPITEPKINTEVTTNKEAADEPTIDWNAIELFGQRVSGLKIDSHRFVFTSTFKRIEKLVSNPLYASNPKRRESDGGLADYWDLHDKIQRAFDDGRKKNVEDYASYIVKLHHGDRGDTPTIDLFSPQALPVLDGGANGKDVLAWPWGLECVPYDGETQLAARFRAAQIDPGTRDDPVVVTITHGKSVEHAMQCFGDRNAKQRRANASITMKMNTRDPILNIVRQIESSVPGLSRDLIEWDNRQAKVADGKIATASSIRTAVACFAHGVAGVQSKTEGLPPGFTEKEFTERALLWFKSVIPGLIPGMKDRKNFVTGAPAIWAGLGMMGHKLADPSLDMAHVETVAADLAAKLATVRWEKSNAWLGIAIKSTPKGGYSFAGGAKDTGSVAYRALADESDLNYAKIRSGAVSLAA